MTTERMLELICLTNFLKSALSQASNNPYYTTVLNRYYNMDGIQNRVSELESELLNPYVIGNAEKSE